NLGVCSITRAELCGAIEGIEFAWQFRTRHIILQMDSRHFIQRLKGMCSDDHQHGALVGRFRELLARNSRR
ncbi:hypothetical protein LINGRAHAP2_LOCUS20432, partial [Linum grandiflorum]